MPESQNPPFPTKDNPPKPGSQKTIDKPVKEETLDEAIQDTFPASDPVAVDTRKTEGDD